MQERDPMLASMQLELRLRMQDLNLLHHPVRPVDPQRTSLLEAQIQELRHAIAARRSELAPAPGT